MRNAAVLSRRELEAHARYVSGVTATTPVYKEIDQAGNKEWLVDVYIGLPTSSSMAIIRNVPVAPFARQLVSGARIPVSLERSRQGKYTVVGRAKEMTAGAQTPDGSILEPTYHEIEYNLADLGLLFIPDFDFTPEAWGDKTWGDADKPWQSVEAVDAFGAEIMGPDVDPADVPVLFQPAKNRKITTRHVLLTRKGWGGPHPLLWGADPWGAEYQEILENVE